MFFCEPFMKVIRWVIIVNKLKVAWAGLTFWNHWKIKFKWERHYNSEIMLLPTLWVPNLDLKLSIESLYCIYLEWRGGAMLLLPFFILQFIHERFMEHGYLHCLNWLPVFLQVQFRVLIVTYKVLCGMRMGFWEDCLSLIVSYLGEEAYSGSRLLGIAIW